MPSIDPAPENPMAQLRKLLWIAVAVAVLLGGILYIGAERAGQRPAAQNGLNFGGPFTLTAADGSVLTDKTLAGKPYAIFFGFTRCPDVCPTTLSRMARLRKALGKDGDKFAIVFVSVDPDRDKPADIGEYVKLFETPIIAATGTGAQIAAIRKSYGIYVAKVPLDPADPKGDYTIDHTAGVFLMDAKGQLSSIIDHAEADEMAIAKLKRLIAES